MKKVYDRDKPSKFVNFRVPIKYINMIDALACEYSDGNRTQMFIDLIEQKYNDVMEQKHIEQGFKGLI